MKEIQKIEINNGYSLGFPLCTILTTNSSYRRRTPNEYKYSLGSLLYGIIEAEKPGIGRVLEGIFKQRRRWQCRWQEKSGDRKS